MAHSQTQTPPPLAIPATSEQPMAPTGPQHPAHSTSATRAALRGGQRSGVAAHASAPPLLAGPIATTSPQDHTPPPRATGIPLPGAPSSSVAAHASASLGGSAAVAAADPSPPATWSRRTRAHSPPFTNRRPVMSSRGCARVGMRRPPHVAAAVREDGDTCGRLYQCIASSSPPRWREAPVVCAQGSLARHARQGGGWVESRHPPSASSWPRASDSALLSFASAAEAFRGPHSRHVPTLRASAPPVLRPRRQTASPDADVAALYAPARLASPTHPL
ncbi:hypothetical protein B0H12DRAFT_1151761 [Mycena haematopus]|nr:hypothetical protein B0H12DRAFT_1151761 [Mycena haematopus]